jgi:predicted secreted protein
VDEAAAQAATSPASPAPKGPKPKTIEEANARIAEQQAASEFAGELKAEKAQQELRNKKGKFIADNATDSKERMFLIDLLNGGWDKSLDDIKEGRVNPQRAEVLAQAAEKAGLIDAFTAKRFIAPAFPIL